MFQTLRDYLWTIVIGLAIFLIRNMNRYGKKRTIIAIIVLSLSGVLFSTVIPTGDHFFTFSTPEKAFSFMRFDQAEFVIEGQESAMVVGKNIREGYTFELIPKCSKGWRTGGDKELVNEITCPTVPAMVVLYRCNETDEYYIRILDLGEKKLDITDSCDSVFVMPEDSLSSPGSTEYFAYVSSYDENYWITINDHKYTFSENVDFSPAKKIYIKVKQEFFT